MPSLRLEGRVALVTGGSRGLGLGVALALAAQGADIALAARGADELDRAAMAVRAKGRRATTIPVDIGSREAPDVLVERTVKELGGLDILVNGAGINLRKPIVSFSREDFASLMRINLEAPMFISQAAGQVMRSKGWGRVICIGSIAAEVAIPNVGLYAMSKGGLRQMVKSMALEWAKDGVVNHQNGRFDEDDRRRLLRRSSVRQRRAGDPDGAPRDAGGPRGRRDSARLRRGQLHHGPDARRRWRLARQRRRRRLTTRAVSPYAAGNARIPAGSNKPRQSVENRLVWFLLCSG